MRITKFHHADHGVTESDVLNVVERAIPADGFFILHGRPGNFFESALYGPQSGDAPVAEESVVYVQRSPDRPLSRMINAPKRLTRNLTVIGIRNGDDLTIFTAYGGTPAPREVGDPSLQNDPSALAEAQEFWSKHALALMPDVSNEEV